MGGIGEVVSGVAGIAGAFGGGGDDEASVQQVQTMTPEQAALLKRMSELSLQEIEKRPVPYTDQLTAGPSALQQQIFGQAQNLIGTGLPSSLQQQLFGGLTQRFGDFMRSPQQVAQQAGGVFDQSVANPARRGFLEELAPQLREQFIGANALSSSGFQRQLAKQASNLEQGLSGQRAAFIDSADQRRLQDILGVSQIAQQQANVPQQQLNQLLQAGILGSEQRGIEQQGLSNQLSEFLRVNQVPTPALAGLLGLPLQASAFQPVVQSPAPSPFAGLLGGFGTSIGKNLFNL